MKLDVNKIGFKTFKWLKVNGSTIEIPELEYKKYNIKSDEDRIRSLDIFDKIEYGASDKSLEINENFGNLYKVYETAENEEKDFGILKLKMDDTNNLLLDTEDIILGENSRLELVLWYDSEGSLEKFRNSIIRIWAKKNASAKIFIIQSEGLKQTSLESVVIHEDEGANISVSQFELGAEDLYTNFKSYLMGNTSSSEVNSIYFGTDDRKLDILYEMNHYGKETNSDIIVNGVLDGNSFKNFKSTLDFKEGSTESLGSEEEYTLLLSDTAKSISVPILLAHEDDVQGNHAASIGKIDKDLVFYMMTRGIPYGEAEALMVKSKFSVAIDEIQDEELKNIVMDKVSEKLRG